MCYKIGMGNFNEAKKFKNKFEISYENYMIGRFQPMSGIIQKFIAEFGEERVMQLVSEYMDEITIKSIKQSEEENSIENFSQFKLKFMKMINTEFMKNTITYSIIEDSDYKMEFKITKCLWARVMKKFGYEGERGYTICCKPDYAMTTAFHKNLKLSRTKTLMQGDDCCNPIYHWLTE